MKYVALLRGINVGGKTKVEMPRLRELFADMGCDNVTTYINSGNVLFEDERPTNVLLPLIEKNLHQTFGFSVDTILRTDNNLEKVIKKVPSNWTNDKEQKTDVMFLWDEINNSDIIKKVKINPEIENTLYIDGALVWNIGRENVTRGGGIKLIKTDLYKKMTVRNINTVRKLYGLLKK